VKRVTPDVKRGVYVGRPPKRGQQSRQSLLTTIRLSARCDEFLSTAPKCGRFDPGQRRDQILDAGSALFAERAYDEISIEASRHQAGRTAPFGVGGFVARGALRLAALGALLLGWVRPGDWAQDRARGSGTLGEPHPTVRSRAR
jgi:hypothetical protein